MTDAFTVGSTAGVPTVTLGSDVTASHCDKHVSADWTQCGNNIGNGTGCVLLSIPCPTRVIAPDNDLIISCPNNVASQPPISIPDSVQLDITLQYDDGKRRAMRYPASNNGAFEVSIIQGADSCEIDFDGTAAPIVRARNNAACTYETCRVKLNYTEPCRSASIISSVSVTVVNAICLQQDVRCPDVAFTPSSAKPDGSLSCRAEASTLRQLSCAAAGFQQRTLWTAALLSPQPGRANGAQHRVPCSASPSLTCLLQLD